MLSRCSSVALRRSLAAASVSRAAFVAGSRRSRFSTYSGLTKNSFRSTAGISLYKMSTRAFAALPRSAQNLELPALSPTMEAGSVAKWHKNVGDRIMPGDLICDIETDKAVVGFEAQEECYLAAILVPAGAGTMNVGTPLGVTVEEESELADAIAAISEGASVGGAPAPAPTPTPTAVSPAISSSTTTAAASTPITSAAVPKPSGVEKLELPALSPTMEAGSVSKWHKKAGDHIIPGDLICDIETDKAVVGFEAQEECYLALILVEANSGTLPVGSALGYTCESEDQIPATIAYAKSLSVNGSTPAVSTPAPAPASSNISSVDNASIGSASGKYVHTLTFPPSVYHMVHSLGLDASTIKATGPKGRLIKDDVIHALEKGTVAKIAKTASITPTIPATAPKASAPKSAAAAPAMPGLTKRQLARRTFIEIPVAANSTSLFAQMTSSKTSIPHTSFSVEVPVAAAEAFCARVGVSFEAFVVRAAAKAFAGLSSELGLPTGSSIDTAILSTTTKQGNNGVELSYPIAQVVKRANSASLGAIDKKIAAIPSADTQSIPCSLLVTLLSSDSYKVSFGLDVLPSGAFAAITLGSRNTKTVMDEVSDVGDVVAVEYVTLAGSFDGATIQLQEAAECMQKLSAAISSPTSMLL